MIKLIRTFIEAFEDGHISFDEIVAMLRALSALINMFTTED